MSDNNRIVPPPWGIGPSPFPELRADNMPAPNVPPPNVPAPNVPPPNVPPPVGLSTSNRIIPGFQLTTQTDLWARMKWLVGTYNEFYDKPQVDSEAFRRNVNRIILETLDHFLYQGVTPLYIFVAKVQKRLLSLIHPLTVQTLTVPDTFRSAGARDVLFNPRVQGAIYEPPFLQIEVMKKVMSEMGSAMGALRKVVVDSLEPQYHKHIDEFHLHPGMAARSDDWREGQACFEKVLAACKKR